MKKLNERIQEYFSQELDEKFSQDKEQFNKLLSEIKISDIDFTELKAQLTLNIETIESRIEELKNYKVKASSNFDNVIDLIAEYEEVKEIYLNRLESLKEYEKKFNEVKKLHNKLI